jgi:hypothetical protein
VKKWETNAAAAEAKARETAVKLGAATEKVKQLTTDLSETQSK